MIEIPETLTEDRPITAAPCVPRAAACYAISGKMIKLKNRRVCLAKLHDGTWAIKFKMLVGASEVKETKIAITDEAMVALFQLYFEAIREESL